MSNPQEHSKSKGEINLKPIYCENVIVAIMWKNKFYWCITHKDLWKLDYIKLYENIKMQYEKMSFSHKKFIHDVGNFEYFCGARWGISILNEKSVDQFLKKIEKNIIDTDELRNMYLDSSGAKIECLPVFFVNFDKKSFYSYFPEPESFERFIPDNWNSEYINFYNLIPIEKVYWNR